jgi:hypothetical protein
MAIFKKGIDTYDYTLLQKKGLIKKGEETKSSVSVTKDGYFVLGNSGEQTPQKNSPTSSSNDTNPLAFFDSFANTTQQQPSEYNALGALGASTPSVSPSLGQNSLDLKDLGVKLEDFEYKLARIAEKLAMIEDKLRLFEEKVS